MAWSAEEEELDKLLGEIPIATSPSPLENHWQQHHHRQIPRPNNPSANAAAQNPLLLETLSDRSLEAALARLNLSSPRQSPVLPLVPPALDGVFGTPMMGNPVIDPSVAQGLSPLSYQQIQQTLIELQRLRVQNAVMGQQMGALMRAHSPPFVSADGFDSFSLSRSNTTAVNNQGSWKLLGGRSAVKHNADDAFLNECGVPCCRYNPSDNSCLQLQGLSSPREFTRRSPIMPCSNGNGFRLDSEGQYRGVAVDGPVLGLENSNALRSPLYNHHRHYLQQQNLKYSLENWRGRILDMAMDQEDRQQGCRLLQKKFEEGSAEEIEMIFLELKDHVGELMVDKYGNYLVQKLLEVCTEEQTMEVLHVVTRKERQFVDICLDMHGTRAVQKLLEHLTTPQQISCLMSALRPGAVKLSKNQNGHHVIQHCLKHFSSEDSTYLLNAIVDHCVEIATDRSGCCVIQLCVEHARGETREHLLAEIAENALVLAQDPFGNYVVQRTLELKVPHVTADILRQFEGNYISLSMQKISSNVVEKCLNELEEEQSTRIIKELLSSPNFVALLNDPFGNYVIKTSLLVSKGPLYSALVDLVQEHIPLIRTSPYGKWILAHINARK